MTFKIITNCYQPIIRIGCTLVYTGILKTNKIMFNFAASYIPVHRTSGTGPFTLGVIDGTFGN